MIKKLALLTFAIAPFTVVAQPTPEQVVNQFLNGQPAQPKIRANHAKGVCISGYFAANGQLANLSKAEIFKKDELTSFIGRFSVPGPNVNADESKVPVRGMALQFKLNNGEQWMVAMNNFPAFAVATPQSFYEQQLAQAPDSATGKPNPEKIAQFFQKHPESANFRAWAKDRTPSNSYASEPYNSVKAFVLVNDKGAKQAVRWQMKPLQDSSVDTASKDLNLELAERLQHKEVKWQLEFTLANAGDPTHDATQVWPTERTKIVAGTLVVDASEVQDNGECRDVSFMPTVLPQGIELGDDPLVSFRSAAYAESLRRRLTSQ